MKVIPCFFGLGGGDTVSYIYDKLFFGDAFSKRNIPKDLFVNKAKFHDSCHDVLCFSPLISEKTFSFLGFTNPESFP